MNFVLVHGGSHAKWCWDAVARGLKDRGHSAYALDLPGHGDDTTPRNTVTVASYQDAIARFLERNALTGVRLVGHSLAGVALPGAASACSSRIHSLIFLAAIVLARGERAIDTIPEDRRPGYFAMAAQSSDNSLLLGYEAARDIFFADFPEAEARRLYGKLCRQPFGVYLSPATVDPRSIACPVKYILCRDDRALPRALCESFARKLGVAPVEIDSGHEAMLSHPDLLCDILTANS